MYRAHHALLPWLALPGTPVPVAALTMIIVVACLVAGRVNGAVLAVASVLAANVATEYILKPLIDRATLGFPSYPSGHATNVFALSAVLAVIMLKPPGRRLRPLRFVVPAAAVLLACVVSTAVIGLVWHYFTDTIAGAAVGIGTVTATALVLDLAGPQRWLAAITERLRYSRSRPAG